MTISNYRKEIGIYNNYRHRYATLPRQEQKEILPLAAGQAGKTSAGRVALLIPLMLLLSQVAQGQGYTLGASASSGIEPAAGRHNHRYRYYVANSDPTLTNVAFSLRGTRNPMKKKVDKPRMPNRYPPAALHKKVMNQHRPGRELPSGTKQSVNKDVIEGLKKSVVYDAKKQNLYADVENLAPVRKTNITATLAKLNHLYEKSYPNIFHIAAEEMRKAIKIATGLTLNPDKIYFHHFNEAQNDPHAFTGWRHDGSMPVETRTLTECMLSNFPADAWDNIDVLDQMTGIYRDSAAATSSFGAENQVPIKSSLVLSIVAKTDFSKLYQAKLDSYWRTDVPEMINFTSLVAGLAQLKYKEREKLSFYLKAFSIIPSAKGEIKNYILDINGYSATDLAVLTSSTSSEIVLYMPRGDIKFYHFTSIAKMRDWFASICGDLTNRKMIAEHFSLYYRQDGTFFDGVHRWLESIGKNVHDKNDLAKIWTNRNLITGELIGTLTENQFERACSDADSLIKSNAEVRRDMLMRYLAIANMLVPNPVTPLISLGLDIDKMIDGDNEVERRQGVESLYGDGINLLLMVLSGALDGRLAVPYDEMHLMPEVEGVKKSFTSTVRDELQTYRANRQAKDFTAVEIHGGAKDSGISFGRHILQSITDLNIEEAMISPAQLSSADEFGIMRDADGESYISINDKIYKVEGIDEKGHYFLGDSHKVGIFMRPKSKKYIKVGLFEQPSARDNMAQGEYLSGRVPEKIFQDFSPRLRVVMNKFHAKGIPAAEIEERILYDKLTKTFVDRRAGKKYLKVVKSYYPVRETDDGYVISSVDEQRVEKSLLRVYFSKKMQGATLITRREWAKENFTLSRYNPPHLKLTCAKSLQPKETALLKELQSAQYQSYYDLPLREIEDGSTPEFEPDDSEQKIALLPPILLKLKPKRCVVKKTGMLSEITLSKIKKNSPFIIENCALAAIENRGRGNIAPEPGYRAVTLEMHLNNRGYPINFSAEQMADGKVAIPGKTTFIVNDIFEDRVILHEADAKQLKDYSNSPSYARKLYAGNIKTPYSRLRHEMTTMEKLLLQEDDVLHMNDDFRAKYTNILVDMANKAVDSPVLDDFAEAGSDFINNWLRFGIDEVDGLSTRASEEALQLLTEYPLLNGWDQFAYRSGIYPAGVYKNMIKAGDIIIDRGFMSASAIPSNSIEWLNNWTKHTARISGDRVIMIFDNSVPKKIASTDFLVDHILVKPGTPLKVQAIRATQDAKGDVVLLVSVSRGTSFNGLKDIFTGAPVA